MAIAEENTKNQAYAVVMNGTDSGGNIKTVEDSLGTLSTTASNWDANKAYAIATALAPLVGQGTLYTTRRVATFTLYDND